MPGPEHPAPVDVVRRRGRAAGRTRRAAVALVAALATPGLAPGSAAAAPRVPADFFGVHVDGPALDGTVPLADELRRIRSTGVRTIRVGVFWHEAQPYRRPEEVPADQRARYPVLRGIPVDVATTDRLMGAAANAGLRVLPVVQGSPRWAADGGARTPNVPPRTSADYARYVRVLAERYGRRGTFWAGRPTAHRRTVRGWQIWNEPNLRGFWTLQPFARRYVRLLRAARTAVRAEDPTGRIHLAGLTSSRTVPAWEALRQVYAAGGRGRFDVAALHPYTRRPSGVLEVVRRARRVAARAGDGRRPFALTELSWSSSDGTSPDTQITWDTTEAGQAVRLRQVMDALARRRRADRIELASWYTWRSPQADRANWSRYAGLSRLRDGRPVDKPALAELVRTVRRLRG